MWFHLFVVQTPQRNARAQLPPRQWNWNRDSLSRSLHLTEAYPATRLSGTRCLPIAEQLADEILSLPMYAELTDEQIEYTHQMPS